MDITSVGVKRLFGIYNHSIRFRNHERITIIHGPNGVGKTTLLRMLKALFSFELHNLAKYDFAELSVNFDDAEELLVVRTKGSEGQSPELTFMAGAGGNKKTIHTYRKIIDDGASDSRLRTMLGVPIGIIEDLIPELDQVGPRAWRVIPTGELVDLEEVVNRYGSRLPLSAGYLRKSIPPALQTLLSRTKIYLIETQRLIGSGATRKRADEVRWAHPDSRSVVSDAPESAVAEISIDLSARIKDALQASGRIAAKLDAQFAYKLITGTVQQIDEDEIRERYARYKKFNNNLAHAGIFENQYIYDLPTKVLEQGDRRALSLYLRDVEEKLQPYQDLLSRVLLFVEIINGRFRNKTLRIDKDRGLIFSMPKGGEIDGPGLSSGEQHELILFYTLLFKVPKASLIAIDEPEISLHVTWQQKFLGDLHDMSEVADLDFVIATHSPSIINGRLDLTVELDS